MKRTIEKIEYDQVQARCERDVWHSSRGGCPGQLVGGIDAEESAFKGYQQLGQS